jgi:quinol monooxygenase YgiN
MLIRIVRMHFTEAGVEEFLGIFNAHKLAIRNFPGCTHLELLKDAEDPTIFTTLSHWQDELHLEQYRKSELFGKVWGTVKTLFAERTQAFSLIKYLEIGHDSSLRNLSFSFLALTGKYIGIMSLREP